MEELEVTLKLLEVQTVLSFSIFASTPFQDLSYVTLFRYSLLIMWGFDPFRRPPRRRRRLAMPRRTLRLIDSLLKIKFKHKFILGDRCSPWRHRRGRRLLNLSFILFLLPRIKPHQPGCYQDLIKTNFNKKATESINSILPTRLSLWHIGWKGHHLWPSVCLVLPCPVGILHWHWALNRQISWSGRKQRSQCNFFVFWKSLIHK